jgi:hypothetical protein
MRGIIMKDQNKKIVNIAVVGSRTYKNEDYILNNILETLKKENLSIENIVVFSGGAKGVDTIAAESMKEMGARVNEIMPNWKKYRKAAGIVRNKELVSNADIVIAFWDGRSRGTKNSINLAKRFKRKLYVFKV